LSEVVEKQGLPPEYVMRTHFA